MAIHHMVFINFKKDAKKADIDLFIKELNKIPERNREVKNWISGFSPEPRFVNGDFDFGLAADLADWDAMYRYMYHEAHVRMRQYAAPVIDYMLAYQFKADYVQPKRFPARPKQAKPRQPRVPRGKVRVPAVRSRWTEDARQIIEATGLRVGSVNMFTREMMAEGRVSPVAVKGLVAGQEPAEDTIVDKGTAVNLTVTGEFWMKPQLPY